MTEQVKKEIIKAYAYGKTPQEPRRLWVSHWRTPKGSRRKTLKRLRKGKASLKAAGG